MIKIKVNGHEHNFTGAPFTRLIDVLRESFGLTGVKEGCGEGECGACTVLVGGKPVCSCLIPVYQVEGATVETVEGLGTPEKMAPLQKCFLKHGGTQCGACTPGFLMTAEAFVRNGGKSDDASIREALAGNLCRCTGYQHIVKSVAETVRKFRKKKGAKSDAR